LLRSPTASQGQGGALGEDEAKRRGNTVGIRDQAMDLAAASGLKVSRALVPTPIVSDWKNGKSSPGYGMNLSETLKSLLPTPTVSDNRGAALGEITKGNPKHRLKVEVELLPTTRVSMANGPTQKEIKEGNPKSRIEVEVMLGETNWGRFEPAIRRWEEILARPAPAPTKPDGKDGAHRLSSMFTEWLMGLPEGWITGLGLKRNDELKLAGNGVVPQQAELALRLLLEDDNLLERIKK
jgi:DNA (cytosine-5)-methyltransferase 1